jgi:hypothetical protein
LATGEAAGLATSEIDDDAALGEGAVVGLAGLVGAAPVVAAAGAAGAAGWHALSTSTSRIGAARRSRGLAIVGTGSSFQPEYRAQAQEHSCRY